MGARFGGILTGPGRTHFCDHRLSVHSGESRHATCIGHGVTLGSPDRPPNRPHLSRIRLLKGWRTSPRTIISSRGGGEERAAASLESLLSTCAPAATIRQRRRNNYRVLANDLAKGGFDLLFPTLPEGVCPLSCPIRVDLRDSIIAALGRRGVETSRWWAGSHRLIPTDEFPLAKQLRHTILPLPVHQQLDSNDMEYIADTMRSI